MPEPNIHLNKEDESTLIRNLEDEIKMKTELIEDANKCIEQFYEEKNIIRAKFKHLMQLFDDPSILPEDESSYREDDDISLGECFVRLEKEALSNKRKYDQRIANITSDNERLKNDLI